MEPNPVQGAQVVHRIAVLMRLVGLSRERGADFGELAAASGLTKPTTHRLLSSLAAEGLLDHDPDTGRWHLGPELYIMGSFAASRFPIEQFAAASVQRLAAATGESAFLSMRRGDETVCLVREEGSFPIRSHVLDVGSRFPIGVGSAGLAIIAHLPSDEQERILRKLDLANQRWGVKQSIPAIRETIDAAQSRGYIVNPGRVVEGSWGMAAAVFDRDNRPAWALSLTGIESRFLPDRQRELGRLLLLEAHRVTTKVRGEATPGRN
jgi:DNA-binding IclR family transcriptional regulator